MNENIRHFGRGMTSPRSWLVSIAIGIPLAMGISACGSKSAADTVSDNLSTEAENFKVQRKIVVVNTITDKVLFEVEGKCSIETPGQLVAICKHGEGDLRKHYLGTSDNVTWLVMQPNGVAVDEFRTKIIFRPESLIPDVDLVTSG